MNLNLIWGLLSKFTNLKEFLLVIGLKSVTIATNKEKKDEYRISSYSFRENYSFFILALYTVTFGHST